MYVLLYGAIQKLPTHMTGALSFIYPVAAHRRRSASPSATTLQPVADLSAPIAILIAAAGMTSRLEIRLPAAPIRQARRRRETRMITCYLRNTLSILTSWPSSRTLRASSGFRSSTGSAARITAISCRMKGANNIALAPVQLSEPGRLTKSIASEWPRIRNAWMLLRFGRKARAASSATSAASCGRCSNRKDHAACRRRAARGSELPEAR